MFDDPKVAASLAMEYRLGLNIARLEIPDYSSAIVRVLVRQTRGPHHFTVLGCSELLFGFVVDTRPVTLYSSERGQDMTYELIDRTSGNFAGVYETEREALRDVAITIAMYGEDDINDLILGFADDTGLKRSLIAEGPALARLASSKFRAVPISADDPQSVENGEEIRLSFRIKSLAETPAHPRESELNQNTVEQSRANPGIPQWVEKSG